MCPTKLHCILSGISDRARLSFTLILFMMVILQLENIRLVIFGAVDFFTALWTLKGLRDLKTIA